MATIIDNVVTEPTALFLAGLDRPATPAGYQWAAQMFADGYWYNFMNASIDGASGLNISSSATSLSSAQINDIFVNLLGRDATAAGQNWVNGLYASSGYNITQTIENIYFMVAAEPTTSQDYIIMADKIASAENGPTALFLAGLDRAATPAGSLWAAQMFANNDNAFMNASIDGASGLNISSSATSLSSAQINDIFVNLLGRDATAAGQNWVNGLYASSGYNITQTILDIYSMVAAEPTTSQDYIIMADKIASAENFTGILSPALNNIASNLVNQDVYTLASTDTAYTFASGTQSDTLVIPFDYMNSSLGQAGNGAYFTFQGDTSGHNAVDINYDPVYTSNISYYLQNATNFQILDFNYSLGDYSNLYSSPLDLSTINGGFNTFILDDTYNTGTNGSYSDYAFTNATNNDTFVVMAASMELDIFSSTNGNGGNAANVIMDGGSGGVGLGTLEFSPSSTGVSNPTVNIDSTGSTLNTIQAMGDFSVTGNNLTGSFTLNVCGSDPLSIGSATYQHYTASNNVDNGIELQDGSTLTIVSHSSSSNLTAYIYENSPTQTQGVTVNAAGFAGTLSLIDEFSSAYTSPNTFILGSGTDSVATNYYNASVTVGSGTDTIVSNAAYSTDSSVAAGESSLIATPGYITTIHGNILAGDSITFGSPRMSSGGGPANWQIYPGLNASGTPSAGTGVVIYSLTQFHESTAASATAAITAVISVLEAPWDANPPSQPVSAAGLLDYAGWFQYGVNTYIVNSDQGQNQVVKLAGTYDLSHATFNSATTATVTLH